MRALPAKICALAPLLAACERPECVPVDYSRSECRVQAENQLARAFTPDGIELRFQDPRSEDTSSWEALGHFTTADGLVAGRVASLGAFRISVHRKDSAATALPLTLTNVHPAIETLPGEVARVGLVRSLLLPLDAPVVEVQGVLPDALCEGGFTLAAVGDIQTGPMTFEDIVEDLHREVLYAESVGKPLMGMLLLGDLAEFGTPEEFAAVYEMLEGMPVPVAVTSGNHDIYSTVQPFFNQTFGPVNYAFDVCDAHFTLLDTGNADIAASIQARLPELLDHDKRTSIVATHMPPYAAQTADGWRREDQAQQLLAEMADRGTDALLAGHIHWRGAFDEAPVPEIIVGTGGASQRKVDPDYGYLRATFGESLQTCFVPLPAPGSDGRRGDRKPEDCPPETISR